MRFVHNENESEPSLWILFPANWIANDKCEEEENGTQHNDE